MVDINSDMWRTIEPLLDHALELPTAERAAWLLNLDAEMPEAAAEVRALLASEEEADRDGFLNERVKLPAPVERATLLSGRRIGDYTIDRLIGRGGMGTVWLARRADGRYEGKVAIKLLNLSLMSDVGRERFRREGSVLARLAHFGVAKLLDAGVADDGQPYLVLEYVDGQPSDAYADARSLGVRERIQLVQQVLSAVDHAHARLIIHRDIKPTNILVGVDGASKLLDFGIAKLLDDNNTTALTSEGTHLLTPDYASPEQLCGDTVTTASDVYAIGVLLFQLLTGGTPFVTGQNSLSDFARIVCGGNPVLPSSRWKTRSRSLAELRELALQRGSTPEKLQREL
ncbi:MAG: serine/threonine-protein kinase, partial [Gemmatimonas sp.]